MFVGSLLFYFWFLLCLLFCLGSLVVVFDFLPMESHHTKKEIFFSIKLSQCFSESRPLMIDGLGPSKGLVSLVKSIGFFWAEVTQLL